nr:RISC-loading complex subunit TARBP2-like [Onthophagus taurus]
MQELPNTQITRADDENIVGNPVGVLQELCLSKGWTLPLYELEHEEGPAHERQFTISCLALSRKEYGSGKSKKLAKRMAAHKMCRRIDELGLQNDTETTEPYKIKLVLDILFNHLKIGASFGIRNRGKILITTMFLVLIMLAIYYFIDYEVTCTALTTFPLDTEELD